MPENPFGGMGSRGEQSAMKAKARAVRSYSATLKRMMGLEAQSGSIAEASAQSAARAISMQNKAIERTSSLLGDQGKQLKNLDQVRQRYHDAEIRRAKSLAFHYEKAKQFLTELRSDTDDTTTVLGMFTRGMKAGVDNMVRFGKLPQASQGIRDVNIDMTDMGGTLDRLRGAAGDATSVMGETFGQFNRYRSASEALDTAMKELATSYGGNEEAALKFGQVIVQQAAIDLPGNVEQVSKLAEKLMYLNTVAGVTAEGGMAFAIERSQQVGISMGDALEEVERFSAMADSMRKHLEKSNMGLTRFSFAVREDFVKAMMEARRMLKGQVVDLENVGAAYQWAARKALEYGSSAEGASKFAKAFGKMVFGQGQKAMTAESMLAGRDLQANFRDVMREQEKAAGKAYEQMNETQQRAAQEAIAQRMGIRGEGEGGALSREQRGEIGAGAMIRNQGGLAPGQFQSMFGTSDMGVRSMLETQQGLFGGLDESTLAQVIQDRYGLDVDQGTAIRLANQVGGGDIDAAVAEITALREEAATTAAAEDPRAALTAVLAMRDPVQELFSIKNYVKAMAMSVDGILGLVAQIPGLGGTVDRLREYTRGLLGDETSGDRGEAQERQQTLIDQGTALQERFKAAHEELAAAGSEGDRERLGAEISDLAGQIGDNASAQGTVGTQLQQLNTERGLLGPGEIPSADGTPPAGMTDAARDAVLGAPAAVMGMLPNPINMIKEAMSDVSPMDVVSAVSPGVGLLRSAFEGRRAPGGGGGVAGGGASQPRATMGRSPEGTMDASGPGTVEVGSDGRAIMNVRMEISNMQEVVAHATTELNQGITNFFS